MDVVLVLHGSADRRYQEAATAFFSAWRQCKPGLGSHLCFLEHAEPLFAEKLEQLAASGNSMVVLPLFLHQGIHATRDIPEAIADIRHRFPAADIRMAQVLNDAEAIAGAMTGRASDAMPDAEAMVVLSHGAGTAGAEDVVREIADSLGRKSHKKHVLPAWMMGGSTHLEDALGLLMKKDVASIVIVPHLLLAGGWIKKVETMLDQYHRRFPDVQFILAEPLGAHPAMLNLMETRLAEAGE